MTTRLQVLFPDDEIAAIRAAAARERVPVATWVRRILREAIAIEQPPPVRAAAPVGRVVREAAPRGYQSAPPFPSDLEQLEALLTRLDGADDDAEAAWDAEIARRLAELDAGTAKLRSLDDVMSSINARLGW
jgi:plasmid stability protein